MKSKIKFDHKMVKAGEETSVYLLAKVSGPKADSSREPLPLNLSVVIDRSGSMSGEKLRYVKMAAQDLVRGLSAKDRLSLVSYGHDVRTELEPRNVDNKTIFRRAIDAIRIQGNTFLSGGWIQGCEFVSSALNRSGVNRVLLLTDGLANEGITNHNQLADMARQHKNQGVTTTTFGVGLGYNEDLLSRMAHEGGGAFYFIDNPDQAEALFKEELKDLYNIVGQNLTVAIETESEVRSLKQLYDYSHREQGGALLYQLGDLYAEEERFQLFELKLKELNEGEVKLGRITISYDALQGEKIKKVEKVHEIVIKVLSAEEFKKPRTDKEVEKIVLVQGVRMARKGALALADQGKFDQAQKILEAIAEQIKASKTKDEELLILYDQLLEEARDMKFGAQRYDSLSRKVLYQKAASSARSTRYEDVVDSLSYREKMARLSLESNGPIPSRIQWRGGELELTGSEITIGSSPNNMIVLQGGMVEEHHCRLVNSEGVWLLHNISKSGTIANGGRIKRFFRLSQGDIIRVGKALLRLM